MQNVDGDPRHDCVPNHLVARCAQQERAEWKREDEKKEARECEPERDHQRPRPARLRAVDQAFRRFKDVFLS